jgi:Flp pilus assembly pilin Flp
MTKARSRFEVSGVLATHSTGEANMLKLDGAVKKFAAGEEGATMVEYSLLVALLAAASIATLYSFGNEINYIFTASNNSLSSANNAITTAS